MSSAIAAVAVTTFLASAVEAIEMVAIVAGVAATRGWRPAVAGSAAGGAVLGVLVAVFGLALAAIPIQPLRLVVGALLLVFGLNWLRKGIRRVAASGFQGTRGQAGGPPRGPSLACSSGTRGWPPSRSRPCDAAVWPARRRRSPGDRARVDPRLRSVLVPLHHRRRLDDRGDRGPGPGRGLRPAPKRD